MPGEAITVTGRSNTDPCTHLQGLLDELRVLPAASEPGAEIARLLWGVSQAADQMMSEHSGMAEELLSVYEQLGVVFEVTRNLQKVQNEVEVIELFLDSLRHSFERRVVVGVRPRARGGWVQHGHTLVISEWVESLIRRAGEARTVLVEPTPTRETQTGAAEVMVAPVFAGEIFICAIVLARAKSVPAFRACDMMLLESLAMFCGDLIRIHRLAGELRAMSMTMVRSLVGAVDQKDEYTSGHSVRVGYFATLLGRKLNLTPTDLQMLQWGALLHDVGKIGIRDEVLKKKGKLTTEEFNHIKEHPERSHKVVEKVSQLAQALDGVLYHHEHYDGTGYPEGLSGEDIPLQARIIQIADVFDALTTNRAYRSAFDWRKALEIMGEEAGKTVDPRLQEIFDSLIRRQLDEKDGAWERMVLRAESFALASDDEDSET